MTLSQYDSLEVLSHSPKCPGQWAGLLGRKYDPLIVVGRSVDAARLQTARVLGATHVVDGETENLDVVIRELTPIGADLVCDASGASRPLDVAIRIVRQDGPLEGWRGAFDAMHEGRVIKSVLLPRQSSGTGTPATA